MKVRDFLLGCGIVCLTGCASQLPSARVPDGLGVNIHFTGAPARDLDMIQAAGFRFIRMDFNWERVEKQKGVYDFVPYDQLTDALQKRGIRPLYILDYGNKLYEPERSVRTEEGRQAFARFAAAAAKHFQGKSIVWELWNEPNGTGFWPPQGNPDQYMALAKVVLPAIRKADPGALRVAPASAGLPWDYLESCFRQGLLDMVEAVTVHPYRQLPPETVEADILKLRALIARYRPDRPDMPILSGEWGYSCVWKEYNDERQGQYLPRQFLTNLSVGIPLSIWYDWHDDGTNPKDPEHHFGTVTNDYKPKPAYLAMQRLTEALTGMHFVKRLQSAPDDYVLLFSDDRRYTVAAWTTGAAHEIVLFSGRKTGLTGDPQYIPVPADAKNILAEAAWSVTVKSVGVKGGAPLAHPFAPQFEVQVRNPFPERAKVTLQVQPAEGVKGDFTEREQFELAPGEQKRVRWLGRTVKRNGGTLTTSVEAEIAGHRSRQEVTHVIMNPLTLSVVPQGKGQLAVVLVNPEREAFVGTLSVQVGPSTAAFRLRLDPEAQEAVVEPTMPVGAGAIQTRLTADTACISLPIDISPTDKIRAMISEGQDVVAESGVVRIQPLQVSAQTAKAFNDGDAKVPATSELTDVQNTESDAPVGSGVRLTYDYGKGWKFVRIAPVLSTVEGPPKNLPVEGKPHAIGAWVRGNGSDCGLNMRFTDQNKRTFQPTFGRLNFTGWRFLTAEMGNPKVGHWGGEGDANQIAYPISINTFILVDGKKEPVKGDVQFAGFCLIYQE